MANSTLAHTLTGALVAAALLGSASLAAAQDAKQEARHEGGKTLSAKDYKDLSERYLTSARKGAPAPAAAWMADLTTDPTARRLNDLVTVNVIENVSAATTADANVGKSSDANVSIPGPQIASQLSRLFPFSSETNFNGAGGTTRSTQLSARLTARVVEVLPNGDLVVEGVREVDVNGDRALVVLTGVIRSVDIQPTNVISSTRIGQLQIKALSQGLIKDSLSPGWLIRALNKIF